MAETAEKPKFTILEDVGNRQEGGKTIRFLSGVIERLKLASLAGLRFAGLRDYYDVFGWEKKLTPEKFLAKYVRQDITSRIIDAPPGATWSTPPTPVDASPDFIEAWNRIVNRTNLWTQLYRADRLARVSPYSVLMFGFDDTGNVERQASNVKELRYIRPFSSRVIKEIKLVGDPMDERFGKPDSYKITFDSPGKQVINGTNVIVGKQKDLEVHWSRTVHVVENGLEDELVGIPIIERIYNLLDDLMKVSGGTAETFWLTANRGLQADIDKDMDINPEDADALSDEIEEYHHQLRRFIRTRGVKMTVLKTDTPRPMEAFDMIISLISGTTGIPRRILIGSEAGQLASEQDRANWSDRIVERRVLYAQPTLLVPTIARLQEVGLLPDEEIEWEWPSAFLMSPLEASMVSAQTARAIGNISRQTGTQKPMQLTSVEEARKIIGLKGDLPEAAKDEFIEDEDERNVRLGLNPDGSPTDTSDDDDDDFDPTKRDDDSEDEGN